MFLGATSKILLAHLPDRALKTVYLENEQTIRRITKVQTWTDFQRQLKTIRHHGYAITDSEIAKGRSAVAAPIMRDDQVVASISLVIANKSLGRRSIEAQAPAVLVAAGKISNRLSNHEPLLTRS
jgi:DNA-binding IclR family transcriptional regulator